jgi:hypothetical protein
MPFAQFYVGILMTGTVTFSGTGLNMVVNSKLLPQYAGVDFTVFVYNAQGELLEQYDAGQPTGETLIFPSPFQNGFQQVNKDFTEGDAVALGYGATLSNLLRNRYLRC